MRLSSLHGLYFASWYLYLNSDGVTYEGGTHRTKRDRTKEPRRKAGERNREGKEVVAREGRGGGAMRPDWVPCVVSELTP